MYNFCFHEVNIFFMLIGKLNRIVYSFVIVAECFILEEKDFYYILHLEVK